MAETPSTLLGKKIITTIRSVLQRCDEVGEKVGFPGEGGERRFRQRPAELSTPDEINRNLSRTNLGLEETYSYNSALCYSTWELTLANPSSRPSQGAQQGKECLSTIPGSERKHLERRVWNRAARR